MLTISIVDKEQASSEWLIHQLTITGISCEVVAAFTDPDAARNWFDEIPKHVDLIFMDLNTAVTISKSIKHEVAAPVIFIRNNENDFFDGDEFYGVDYLMRPVSQEMLIRSLNRFHKLKSHFINAYASPAALLNGQRIHHYKERVVVKKGAEYQSIKTEDVAFFFSERKLVFLVDKEGRKYLTDASNLTDLGQQLNRKVFFRANRKYIININFIKKYKTCDRVKLEVELCLQNPEMVMISQENSGSFKEWIENL